MKNLMKALGFALVVPLACTSVLLAQAPPENPKFTLAINTDKAQVTKGQDVVISIKITNISGDPMGISFGYHGRMPNGYHFEIRDDQGNEVHRFGPRYKQSPDGKSLRLPDQPAGSSRQADIPPGKSMEGSATISDEFPFDHADTYSIRVWRPAKIDSTQSPDSTRGYSNTITVTVLPSGGTSPGA